MIGTLKLASMQLGMIRLFLTEALKTGEVLHSDGDRAMIRQIAYQLLGVENALNAIVHEYSQPVAPTPALPTQPAPPEAVLESPDDENGRQGDEDDDESVFPRL